jgi:hypothetical protein
MRPRLAGRDKCNPGSTPASPSVAAGKRPSASFALLLAAVLPLLPGHPRPTAACYPGRWGHARGTVAPPPLDGRLLHGLVVANGDTKGPRGMSLCTTLQCTTPKPPGVEVQHMMSPPRSTQGCRLPGSGLDAPQCNATTHALTGLHRQHRIPEALVSVLPRPSPLLLSCVLPRYRPQQQQPQPNLVEQRAPLLYYADWPRCRRRRRRCCCCLPQHVVAAPPTCSLIINFAGDVPSNPRPPSIPFHLSSRPLL